MHGEHRRNALKTAIVLQKTRLAEDLRHAIRWKLLVIVVGSDMVDWAAHGSSQRIRTQKRQGREEEKLCFFRHKTLWFAFPWMKNWPPGSSRVAWLRAATLWGISLLDASLGIKQCRRISVVHCIATEGWPPQAAELLGWKAATCVGHFAPWSFFGHAVGHEVHFGKAKSKMHILRAFPQSYRFEYVICSKFSASKLFPDNY